MRWTLDEYQGAIKAREVACLGPFFGITKKTKHLCLKCRAEFSAIPDNVYRGKTKCPMCSSLRMHLDTDLYNGLIAGRGLKLVGEFVRQTVKSKHSCLACSYTWDAIPDNVLVGHGCPACSKDRANSGWKRRNRVRVGLTSAEVQGYEPQALEYLRQAGCDLNKLVFHTDCGKPTFKYEHLGKRRLYIPDFYHVTLGRVIEVKSTWSLAGTKAVFYMNCAKSRAVLRAGYEFHLLLMDSEGRRIPLPKTWYLLSYRAVRRTLGLD